MAQIRLSKMNMDNPPNSVLCGVSSIDNQIRDAYSRTLFKQAVAYNVLVDGNLVGNCMIRLVWLCDETAEYYVGDSQFIALEISYIAIDRRFQRKGIGTRVLQMLLQEARRLSEIWPVRFLVLDAFCEKEDWYTSAGFKRYPKVRDLRYPGTVPMRIDLIDIAAAEGYAESLV